MDRLAENATTLGEPCTRHLGGKVRELRFDVDGNAQRITYWIAISRIEGGGTVPTIPLLRRLAHALDADLTIHLTPHGNAA